MISMGDTAQQEFNVSFFGNPKILSFARALALPLSLSAQINVDYTQYTHTQSTNIHKPINYSILL